MIVSVENLKNQQRKLLDLKTVTLGCRIPGCYYTKINCFPIYQQTTGF